MFCGLHFKNMTLEKNFLDNAADYEKHDSYKIHDLYFPEQTPHKFRVSGELQLKPSKQIGFQTSISN